MAAAVILIPEMLSGPDREPAPQTAHAGRDNGIKTYTIDLDGTGASTQTADEIHTAPPQESLEPPPSTSTTAPSVAAPADETFPESASQSTTASRSSSQAATREPDRVRSQSPQQVASVPRAESSNVPSEKTTRSQEGNPSPTLASQPAIPKSKGWAVQLGSFSNRESAERLAREFQAERYDAFVMPVNSGGSTLYRVRLGPMNDRSAAEEALKRAKVKVSGAAVVAHP